MHTYIKSIVVIIATSILYLFDFRRYRGHDQLEFILVGSVSSIYAENFARIFTKELCLESCHYYSQEEFIR